MDEARLRQVPLFAAQSKRLAPLVEEVDVPAGHELAHQGDVGYELFVIAEGSAAVSEDGYADRGVRPGDFFG